MRMNKNVGGVALRRSIATGRHGWTAVFENHLVKFKPFLGWRSRKPIEWQAVITINGEQLVLRERLLRDIVSLAKDTVTKRSRGVSDG